jgi:hypothetical protein
MAVEDGHVFGPQSADADGSFVVGADGVRRRIPDFWAALAELQVMPEQAWEIPGPGGRRIASAASRWERVVLKRTPRREREDADGQDP